MLHRLCLAGCNAILACGNRINVTVDLACITGVADADEHGIDMVGANLALEACRAGSAGVSLSERSSSAGGFTWTALAGIVFGLKRAVSSAL